MMRYITHAAILLIVLGVFLVATVSADLRGDVNSDGRANALDALLILQDVAGLLEIKDFATPAPAIDLHELCHAAALEVSLMPYMPPYRVLHYEMCHAPS